jgi:hypothetical protein
MGPTLVFSSHCIAGCPNAKNGGYHGYRFLWKLVPQGRIHRQQGKSETSGKSLSFSALRQMSREFRNMADHGG